MEDDWRELPTPGQRLMAVYILGFQYFQAYTGIVVPLFFVGGLVLKAPMAVVLAAVMAQYRHLRKRTNWVKTTHVGAHLETAHTDEPVLAR